MHEFSLEYLRCVRCHSKLELQTLKQSAQIDEGFLYCPKCSLTFPIIDRIPILWDDFTSYLSNRPRLGGDFLGRVHTTRLRSFVRQTLGKIRKNLADQSLIEQRWSDIYKKNKHSQFYLKIKNNLKKIPKSNLALEHGCSIGTMTQHLAKTHSVSFGIDKSYHAILEAKKSTEKNLDFFVADSLEHPFGKTKFDLVVGLNLFELIEPKMLLRLLAAQTKKGGWLVLSDPYDFERGTKSVREPLYEDSIRKELARRGFAISSSTKKPSNLLWSLRLYKRATLQYKVDLVLGKKIR